MTFSEMFGFVGGLILIGMMFYAAYRINKQNYSSDKL